MKRARQVSKSFKRIIKLLILLFYPINISFNDAEWELLRFTFHIISAHIVPAKSTQEVLPLPLYCNTSDERNMSTQIKTEGNKTKLQMLRALQILWVYS